VAFLAEVDAVNRRARERAVALATRLLGGVCAGRRVGVLGAAFKPNSDDVRDSPALEVADALRRAGAQVRVYDPAATSNAQQRFPDLDYVTSALAAVAEAELVAHLTEWAEFRDLDPVVVAAHVDRTVVLDGRGALDEARWRAAGWEYHALGRPPGSAGSTDGPASHFGTLPPKRRTRITLRHSGKTSE
jgi:UDPglucose 6-dehydrogenase